MPEPAPIELSTGEPWRGLKPGMPRAEAVAVLTAANASLSDDANDPSWLVATTEDWGLELRFEESGEQRVRQIALDDWEWVWAGEEIAGKPLHTALAAMGADARDARWRPEAAMTNAFDDLAPVGPGPFADEALLADGTLWLPRRGLGLVMCEGALNEAVWRRAEDVPKEFAGPLTDAQREFTKQPDFEQKLRARWRAAASPSNPVQTVLTLLLVVALSWIGREGFREMQRWQHAQLLTGKLVAIEKATKKPWIDRYVVRFTDPRGHAQMATLEHGEFYIAPSEPGEETQVAYLDGDPPRAKGPARARDAAFLEYVPWAVGAFAIYVVLWTTAGFISRLLRSKPGPASAPRPPTPPQPFMPDRGK